MGELKLFSGSTQTDMTKEIASQLGINVSPIIIKKFKDSETYIKIKESIRGDDIFFVQSTCSPVNESLMELLIVIDAMKRASAGRINVVIPYFGYARQDRKASSREPITAKLVADLITVAGADRVVCVDLHCEQIQGFFDIPVDHFFCFPVFMDYFAKKKLKNMVMVSSDAGFAKKARRFAQMMEVPLAIIDKRRPEHNKAEVVNVIGDVKGKTAILVDDMIDTGGTIGAGADALLKIGAKEVYICATHGILSDGAAEKLSNCAAKEIIVSDTIPLPKSKIIPKLKICSIASLMAQVIFNIHEDKSVGQLFGRQ